MPPRAGRLGQKRVALDGDIDGGSTPHHPRHRHCQHSYSDRYQHKGCDDNETVVNGTYLIFCFFLFSAGLVACCLFHVGLSKKERWSTCRQVQQEDDGLKRVKHVHVLVNEIKASWRAGNVHVCYSDI